jgi:hypothetical protein
MGKENMICELQENFKTIFFFNLDSTGVEHRMQALALPRQVLYHLSHSLGYFSDNVLLFA